MNGKVRQAKLMKQNIRDLKPSFVKMRELIQEISEALIKTADIVEQTDSDIAGQFNS